jgi:hypothetical protein
MISNEFKDLVKGVKDSKWKTVWDVPYNVLIDKITGEPKQNPKNIITYNLITLVSKLPESELKALSPRYKSDSLQSNMQQFVKSTLGGEEYWGILTTLSGLFTDYRSKMKTILAKKDREVKKLAVANEKNKLILSLSRSDIKNSMDMIKKSMEPYIKSSENSIKETITKKETEFLKEWKEIEKSMEKDGVELVNPSKSIEGKIMYSGVRYDGPAKSVKEYIRYNFRNFFVKWFDNKGYGLSTSAKYIANGQASGLINSLQKQFRESQEFKVEVLFHRLIKTNPTLKGYTLTSPYNGNEFMMEARNDKGEKVIITTNTILAGGYNIQRLHSRWLVQLRNSVTGKQEKFTIDDKTKA